MRIECFAESRLQCQRQMLHRAAAAVGKLEQYPTGPVMEVKGSVGRANRPSWVLIGAF
ncbi:hypothetical protein AAD027_14970 [Pseudoxanthomonas putridarboris]|uniref:Uncharacterized protein n=2 Tax=Pseudoxanthomonas putridarboris TaxID=752605 RepID=A0ABU9J342_9GAMM